MVNVLCALLFVGLPALILKLRPHLKIIDVLGPVVVAYALGIVLGQVLPAAQQPLIKTLSEAAVPLSIPLLLFSQNPRTAFKGAGRMLLCFLLAAVGVSLSATLVSVFWVHGYEGAQQFPEYWQVAGMLVGTYTGGTPNMASIGLSLAVPERIFLMSTAADTVLGGLYLMALVSVAKPVARFLLPADNPVAVDTAKVASEHNESLSVKEIVKSLGLSIAIAALSIGGALLVTGSMSVPVIMLLLTALALGVACIPAVNRIKNSYVTGEYLILIFCLAIGALIRLDSFELNNLYLFAFATAVMTLGIGFHALLARLFKLDADHFLMASTAAVFGPPFVGVVARAIHAPQLVASGLAVGVLGYALGNYLGLLMAYGIQLLH